jgi:tRNA uridine 5-carbamoylmethylation protein Kti12
VRPAIVLILGYPGTGKFTVAKELVSALSTEGTPVRLIDNHVAANILFDLIAEADGQSVLPLAVLDNVREINLIIARTIDELSPLDWSFVLTHHFRDNERNDSYVGQLQTIARRRGATFLPVILTCEHGVLVQRVTRAERRSRNKLVDPSIALSIIQGGMLIPKGSITIDVTSRTPAGAVTIIREELAQRSKDDDF